MSHYGKWYGGYYYGSWKKSKDEDKDKSKTPTSTGWGTYPKSTYDDVDGADDDYDAGEVDYSKIYRSRYKSGLGYTGGLYSGSWSYYGSSYGASYASCSGLRDKEKFSKLKQLLTSATKEARDLIVILDFPFNVSIKFGSMIHDTKNGARIISVPTEYFDDKSKSDGDKIGIFCSLAVHEAAHLKFTEYLIYKSFIDSMTGYSDKRKRFIGFIFNLIEDERVEDQLLKARPGYLEFIEKEKLHQYDRFIKACESLKDTAASNFLLNLCKLIRFPKNIDMDVVKEYCDIYEEVGNIISPLPDSTKGTCEAAVKVFKAIINHLDESRFDIRGNYGTIDHFLDELDAAIGKSFEVMSGGSDAQNNDKITETMDILKDRSVSEVLEGVCDGEIFVGSHKDTFFKKITPTDSGIARYNRHKSEISKYIPGIRKIISGCDRNFEFNIFGCRSGLLDTTKLAEAYQGIPQVYVRKGISTTNKLSVCVLVDESGSMGGCRMDGARRGAILLNEALKNNPNVDLYIYGHSGDILYDGSTEINIYREGTKFCPNFSLGEARARCENRDGTAILEVGKRVRSLCGDRHVLMFVLSDGEPAAHHYYGPPAYRDVREKVTEVQKMGIDVVQISIERVDGVEEMFDNYIEIYHDAANMAKNLAGVVKKLIQKNKHTTIIQ